MDKEQEILAVSRLVFELTRVGDGDLDAMLGHLDRLLRTLPGMQVLPHSLILLRNSRHGLTQVAQFGLPPAWESDLRSDLPAEAPSGEQAYPLRGAAHVPPLLLPDFIGGGHFFVLPLFEDGDWLGNVLLAIDEAWQPDSVEIEFMTDLGRALSMLVSRRISNETLRAREVELEHARSDAIRRLGTASEYRDNETGMHIMRMTHIGTAIAKAMGMPPEERELLAICAPMHDVGKIGIPDAILLKPGKLSEDEFEIMKRHTDIGRRLLSGNDVMIERARQIAASHHERWDGMGYPLGLKGEAIPLFARICAVSDVFDALTSIRPYKAPWSVEEAVAWVRANAGSQFDPAVVAGFDKALPEIIRIRELYRDDIIDPRQVLDLPERKQRSTEWVRWNEHLSVGIDVIDEHHRYLFDLTNDLFDVVSARRGAREVARVLKALEQYAQVHFRAEEKMMSHHGYAALGRQLHQHGRFEDQLRAFYTQLHDNPLVAQVEVLHYLRDWLLHHIIQEDSQLRALAA